MPRTSLADLRPREGGRKTANQHRFGVALFFGTDVMSLPAKTTFLIRREG